MNAQSKPLRGHALKLILWLIDLVRPLDVLLGLLLIFSSLMFTPLGFFVFGSWTSFIFLQPLHLLLGLLFIFQPYRLGGKLGRSESMAPTIMPGDIVFLNPLSVFWRGQRKRGDIVLFQRPSNLIDVTGSVQRLCKRVIGLPGDRIKVERGIGVFINDQILDESSYLKEAPDYNLAVLGDIGGMVEKDKEFFPYRNSTESNQPIVVPPCHFFVLGDNRNNSLDSHHFGFVDQKMVVASVLFVWKLQTRPVHVPLLNCSHCQKSQKQVKKLIQGPDGVHICNECVLLSEIALRTKQQTYQGSSSNVVCAFCKKTVDAVCTFGETFKICSECLDLCKEILLEKSLDDLSKDIDRNPTSASAYAARAHAYTLEKEFTKAAEDWNKTIELSPDNAEYYLARGNNLTELCQYEQAIGDLTTSIKLNPKLIDAYCCRSFVYIQLGRLEDAIADSDQAIILDPQTAAAHNNKGKSLILLGKLEEALPYFDKAIECNSVSYPIFFYNRGYVLQSLGQPEKAADNFTQALKMNPKLGKAYEARANAYEAMGKHELAAQDRDKFKQAVAQEA